MIRTWPAGFSASLSSCVAVLLFSCLIGVSMGTLAATGVPDALKRDELRVCADPNNMPFSNKRREGFENALAELVARDLGKTVSYTWHAQRRGFIRNTLKAGECDVIMGTAHLDMIATTRSYYKSSYVFISRADRELTFSSMNAPELKDLSIGVHLIGDDGANTPPVHALGQQNIVDNVVGYMIYGDYRNEAPAATIIKAVADGEIDIAAVWGPLAGYHAKQSKVPLRVVPITDTLDYLPTMFQYAIAMGVRKDDLPLKAHLNEVIYQRKDEIHEILDRYGVPLAGSSPTIMGGSPAAGDEPETTGSDQAPQ